MNKGKLFPPLRTQAWHGRSWSTGSWELGRGRGAQKGNEGFCTSREVFGLHAKKRHERPVNVIVTDIELRTDGNT